MSLSWGIDDRRRQIVYVVNAGTPLSMLVHVNADYVSLVLGENRGLLLRLSPAGVLRVVRLLQSARA